LQLVKAKVTNYKSIDDSGWVDVDAITCMVGKNESGKTAFLHALNKLNPVEGQDGQFDATTEFPRKRLNRYKREHENNPATAVTAVFALGEDDMAELPGILDGAISKPELTVSKNYKNRQLWSVGIDQAKVIDNIIASAELPAATAKRLDGCTTVRELRDRLDEIGEDPPQAAALGAHIDKWDADPWRLIINALQDRLPRFFYFDDYSIMEGRISVPHLKAKRDNDELSEADRTFLALLRFVGADLEEFESEANYERLKADLEAASNEISDELFRFWSQNDRLAVEFDISGPDQEALPPLNQGTNLHVRVRNDRHRVTVPFDQRSRGFVWFFSFLAYFSSLKREKADCHAPLILLLDEPGLNLHAKAQEDFLEFIEQRLAGDYQVVYTTHSPFMIEPRHLDRVRTVEDVDDEGTRVSDQVFRSGSDTVFPVQAALGYELAQTLFVAPDNLLVEGPADMIYLTILDEAVREAGGEGLDGRWVIVPVGGVDKIATFVTLLGGNQLNASVLIDVSAKDQQRIENLRSNGHLGKNSLVHVGEITGATAADIEDIFDAGFYLQLVNGAYADKLGKKLTLKDLPESPRIAKRIERYFADNDLGRFSHYPPAAYFQREQVKLKPKLSEATVERAGELFARVNETLSKIDVPDPNYGIQARRTSIKARRTRSTSEVSK